jgi:hypothetical protein
MLDSSRFLRERQALFKPANPPAAQTIIAANPPRQPAISIALPSWKNSDHTPSAK